MPVLPERLPVEAIPPGKRLYRAHSPIRGALYFGPDPGRRATHRFHAPDGAFRTCFLGLSEEAAFAEGVLHGPLLNQAVSATVLATRAIARVRVVEPVVVVRLFGPWLIRTGATAAVTHGDDYPTSQDWAAAIHAHPQGVDGILYTSRHDETTFSLALFDRAAHKVEAGPSRRLSAEDKRTMRLLARYGLGLEP